MSTSCQQTVYQPPGTSGLLGGHDPLLDWALRESQCGLATRFDSSGDGLARFATHEGVAAGMHLCDAVTDTWNVQAVASACASEPAVLVEWAKRRRGLIRLPEKISEFKAASANDQ